MKLIDYLAKPGQSQSRFARALSVTPGAVWQWANDERPVPAERCVAIERASDGAVRRWDLRPDDWHRIWPELIGAEGAPTVPADQAAKDAA